VPNDTGFRRLADGARRGVTIHFDGQPVGAREGESVAAALLAAGHAATRITPGGAAPRGPYCMMGVCFDCLVEVDGVPNMQACMTPVRDGMEVRPMRGARGLDAAGGGDG
jgi:predicted molibdopterin-dependent oxidoreductase YjgC